MSGPFTAFPLNRQDVWIASQSHLKKKACENVREFPLSLSHPNTKSNKSKHMGHKYKSSPLCTYSLWYTGCFQMYGLDFIQLLLKAQPDSIYWPSWKLLGKLKPSVVRLQPLDMILVTASTSWPFCHLFIPIRPFSSLLKYKFKVLGVQLKIINKLCGVFLSFAWIFLNQLLA